MTLVETKPIVVQNKQEAEADRGGAGRRFAWTGFAPRAGTSIGIALGCLVSLAPGLLPRTPLAQAILTALLVLVGLAMAGVTRMALRRTRFDASARTAKYRPAIFLGAVLLVIAAGVHATQWQNRLRDVMGVSQIGPGYWVRWMVSATLLVGLVTGLWGGLRWSARRLGRARGIAVGTALALSGYFMVVPAVVDWRQAAYAAADAYVDPEVAQPVSPTRSGSPESVAGWESLGAQGRRFVAGEPARAVRVYVGLHSAPDLNSRVALAIQELERSGGFARRNLVVAVPTGSGWIDGGAVQGIDERFGGDVAVVGLQYSAAPSWVTFIFGRKAAEESAKALFTAVEQRLSRMNQPPKLHIYGQSLGALGGSSVFTDEADQDRRTCSAVWAGPPAGAAHRSGATVLANASDPVVHWSPSLLWKAPDLTGTRPDAPVPQWLPVVSFLQTSADLLAALDAPPGHGHRYGTDQGTSLGAC
ncbi:alpha/beta-hydrolase family protein [Nocardia huaxiensis]|uniref:Alpha/beta-hydrolase family protein n=1 Tax=Nocardia huaxiensis TaxID=2755382 RepID=A0A7D6VH89_9NOCA|nr:alpha/beta-hydrolase family protein [Nocardia huaxiensis]QLY30036.1 alpha/beta-hydrolase family protein [Nocardia huaxiensis]UFS96368.1 alpha/beta-hydrolase family protein [Nocardia huaxiensis]